MFRPLFKRLRVIRLTPLCPTYIGATLTTSVIQAAPGPRINKTVPFFTPSFRSPMLRPGGPGGTHGGNPQLQITNYNITFQISGAGLAIYHYLNYLQGLLPLEVEVKSAKTGVVELQSKSPKTAEHIGAPEFQIAMPSGFVPIDYAIDAFIKVVNPQRGRDWLLEVILTELDRELMVFEFGETFLCRKDRVDGFDWGVWWDHWAIVANGGLF